MIPSRGFARVRPGLAFHNQILSRAPARSKPRQAISRPAISGPRQFGTSDVRSNGTPVSISRASTIGFLSGTRIGAASNSSSSIVLAPALSVSNHRRFASTNTTTPPAPELPPSPAPEPEFSSFSDFDAPSILNVPEGLGYLANLGLDYGQGPTSVCQWVVEHIHFTMGLGWLGAIIGGAAVIRAVMVYPAFVAQLESHKSQEMRKDPVYQDRQQQFMVAIARGASDPAEMMQLRMQMKYIREQHGIKTGRMFLPMLQIPFAYGMFKLTRDMANLPVPGLEDAGALWFTDLTVADPLYILPSVGALTMYLSVRRSLPFMATEQASLMKFMPFILGPLTFIITLNFPAAVQVYFAVAAILQYFQTTLWHVPFVRKLCGLPPLEATIINPAYIQKKPASPFANTHVTYQAPRTVDTTATEHKPEEDEKKKNKGFQSPLSMFRDASKQVSKGLSSLGTNPEQAKSDAAAKFERKRMREENERYMARKIEAQRKQELKKAGGKK